MKILLILALKSEDLTMKGEITMIITISLSKTDLERIKNVLGIESYDDIHNAFVDAFNTELDRKEFPNATEEQR